MVKQLTVNDKRLYACEACGAVYERRATAEACQKWCVEHGA